MYISLPEEKLKSFKAAQKRGTITPLPISISTGGRNSRSIFSRGRQIRKTLNNIKITILCGFVTILVLRGTIGIDNLIFSDSEAENENENQLIIEETNRILADIRSGKDPDYPDESSVESEFNANVTNTLGSKIMSNWDRDKDCPNYINGKARILLVTSSPPNPIGDHLFNLLKSTKNKIDYCRKHGIKLKLSIAWVVNLDKELARYRVKLPLIRRLDHVVSRTLKLSGMMDEQ